MKLGLCDPLPRAVVLLVLVPAPGPGVGERAGDVPYSDCIAGQVELNTV